MRWLARLDPAEEAAYRAAVGSLAGRIELSLGSQVMANRVVPLSARGDLTLEPWRTARRRFLREARAGAAGAGALLVADVRRCYASIDPTRVGERLRSIGCPPREVASVVGLLRRFESDGVRGLPVGPEPSAVLANAVLARADRAVAAAGARHLRWVDDFAVFARDRAHAERVLWELAACLEGMGLGLAEEKTRFVDDVEAIPSYVRRLGMSCLVRPYNRPSDANALPGLRGSDAVLSPGGGVVADRRAARAAGGDG